MTTAARLRIDRHLDDADLEAALRRDVRWGLSQHPKTLPPKWLYDDRGSALFDEITRLPEYYPTRRERVILEAHAADIAAHAEFELLIELGSGTSTKTRILLDALGARGRLRGFAPFDVSEATLVAAARDIAADHPELDLHAVVGDFERHLQHLPGRGGGRRLVAFLGGTIGNLVPDQRARFLTDLRDALDPGDSLLLGTDLVKDPTRLVAAYDDAAGVTAAFDRNVLHVLNRRLGADFDPDGFTHLAVWDAEREWIEMRLRAERAQEVTVAALDLVVGFRSGEALRTEISAKFRRTGVEAELATAGFALDHWWTDPAGDFALSLSSAR